MMYNPASGGSWYILRGQYVTLAELFRFGWSAASCYDLYRTYVSLPILIYRRTHSTSHSSKATKVMNAKKLRHTEEG